MNRKNFFVDVTLVDSFRPQFYALIPEQRRVVNEMMNEGILVSYSLSLERTKLWVVMEVKSEQEVLDVLAKFPLIKFMKPEIHELAFHDNVHSGFPHLSLN